MSKDNKKAETKQCTIPSVTTRLFNYKCTKCGSTYTELKKPLNYSDCQVYKGRNPNPILCGGRLISTN